MPHYSLGRFRIQMHASDAHGAFIVTVCYNDLRYSVPICTYREAKSNGRTWGRCCLDLPGSVYSGHLLWGGGEIFLPKKLTIPPKRLPNCVT